MAEDIKKDEVLDEKNDGTENTNPDTQDKAEGTEDPKTDDKKAKKEKKGLLKKAGELVDKVKEDPKGCAVAFGKGVVKYGTVAVLAAGTTAYGFYKIGKSITEGTAGTGDTGSPVNEDGTVNSTATEVNDGGNSGSES